MVEWSRSLTAVAVAVAAAVVVAETAHGGTAPKGIDVSNWQGQIEWIRVEAAGFDFAYAKATEGTSFSDALYPLNRTGASSAGLRVGAYHFARPEGKTDAEAAADAIAEADHFVSVAQPVPGDLLPALDLERTGRLPPHRLAIWAQAWLDEVVARLGVKPVVYVSTNFWKRKVADATAVGAADHPLWIANWTKAKLPALPGAGWGGSGWTFWQWTDCERIRGIAECVGGNRFNGASLAGTTIAAYPSAPPVHAEPPVVLGTPQTGGLLAAVPGRWSGGKPVSFAYQWQRCDAVGAACTPIAGAAGGTYRPTSADAGHALVVTVTAWTGAGTATVTSPPTLAVASSGAAPVAAPKPISEPSIGGSARAGRTLTARAGAWTGAPTAFVYQWRRCAADGTACAAIPGAGSIAYSVSAADVGASLSLVVTATGRGGSRSATAPPTPVVAAAPVPTPKVRTAIVRPARAGSVRTASGVAMVTWQPGALLAGSTVSLTESSGRLAIPGTVVSLGIRAARPLSWPVDVAYGTTAKVVAAFLSRRSVWMSIPYLAAPSLPEGQAAGAYRDDRKRLHVLTRRPGRIGLFVPGRWGDPRFVAATPPRLTLVTPLAREVEADGVVALAARLTLDSQAHVSASVVGPGARKPPWLLNGSRVGRGVTGSPTRTLRTLQRRPGLLAIRLRIPAADLVPAARYSLRLVAVDPYRRRSELVVPFRA